MKLFGGKGRNTNNDRTPPRNTEPKSPAKKKKWLKALLVVLIVIAVIVGGFALYWVISTKAPEPKTDPPLTEDGENNGDDDNNATPDIVDNGYREIGRYYTTLVVGMDQEGYNTDTIMVMRYDAVERKVNLVSIPRDTLVNVPWATKKINTVYIGSDNGIDGLLDETEKLLGARPDRYVLIDTSGFEKIVDALGGIRFDVPQDMDYVDDTNHGEYVFTIHVDKGPQLLNGYDAMGVWRFRQNSDGTGYPDGDIGRLAVQHDLMFALAEQLLQERDLTKLLKVIQVAIECSETDMLLGEIQWYAKEFMEMNMEDIEISTIPANYFCHIRYGAYASIYVDEWLDLINEKLNPMKAPVTREDLEILYQVAYDGDVYTLDPSNYLVTNGAKIAGGLNSFAWTPPK